MVNFKQLQHEQLINFTEKENNNNIHVHMLMTLVLITIGYQWSLSRCLFNPDLYLNPLPHTAQIC